MTFADRRGGYVIVQGYAGLHNSSMFYPKVALSNFHVCAWP